MKYYFILLSISILASAQHWAPPLGGGLDRENTKMIKKWKLIEFLDISEDQSDKFFTRINSYEKEIKSIGKREKNT